MNKGFTLVELLAVIVILAVILVIAIPQVLKVVDNSRLNSYINQEQLLIRAAELYVSNNTGLLPTEIGDTILIELSELQSHSLIGEITDLRNKNIECDGYVLLRKNSDISYDYVPYIKCADNYVSTTIITDGLILDMPLGNHTDGNIYLDRSDFNNHGTNYGSTLAQNRFGEENNSTFFSGGNNYILIDESDSFLGSKDNGQISYTWWMKPEGDGSDNEIFRLYINSNNRMRFRRFSSTNFRVGVVANGSSNFRNIESDIEVQNWQFFVYLIDGSEHLIYKNGEFKGSVNLGNDRSLNLIQGNPKIYIGRPSGSFFGTLDEIRVYGRRLSEDEIKHIYNVTKYKLN